MPFLWLVQEIFNIINCENLVGRSSQKLQKHYLGSDLIQILLMLLNGKYYLCWKNIK